MVLVHQVNVQGYKVLYLFDGEKVGTTIHGRSNVTLLKKVESSVENK